MGHIPVSSRILIYDSSSGRPMSGQRAVSGNVQAIEFPLCFHNKGRLVASSNGSSQVNLPVGHEVARHLHVANTAFFVSFRISSVA